MSAPQQQQQQQQQRPLAVPDHIDEAAQRTPTAVWATVPVAGDSFDQGWKDYTFADLAKAVNHVAWWIEKTVGVARRRGEVLGYMGANDLRYLVVLGAALKTGYVPLFTSPRNSLEGQTSLLQETGCEVFLTTEETRGAVEAMQEAGAGLRAVATLPMATEMVEQSVVVAPYEGRHGRGSGDVSVVLHTSGSTGIPKPIFMKVGSINTIYDEANLAPEGGRQQIGSLFFDRSRLLAPVPFFHAMGIMMGLRSIICKGVMVRTPSAKAPSSALIIEAINKSAKPTCGLFPPSMLEDVASTQEGMQALGKLETLFTGGAPLSAVTGDKVCKVTRLVSVLGSTEALLINSLLPVAREDWNYFHWASEAGAVMEPTDDDGNTCELVITPKDARYQAVFHTFPDLQEWRTKDLFRRHPSQPRLWTHVGRRDDVVVLSNGEKFNPVCTEKLLESHPSVKSALVVGQKRFQAGLLIEPASSADETQDAAVLIDRIWPLIEQANSEAPAHARIYQNKIVVLGPDKAFQRAAKGSVMRQQTMALLHDEIEALYADEGYASGAGSQHGGTSDGVVELSSKIRAVFAQVLPSFTEDVGDDVDITSLGVDSLAVLTLVNALKKAIPGATITTGTIYANPSVALLAAATSKTAGKSSGAERLLSREEKMDAMVRKYTHDMAPSAPSTSPSPLPENHTIVLTGSTGSLGSHILEQLLQHPRVEHVYCLNRDASAASRQTVTFEKYHSPSLSLAKATFLTTDFSLPHFGLADAAYETLLRRATLFIHNAWSVDFNLSLESYEPTHVAGTRRVADFAADATHRPRIVFVSSIGSIGAATSAVPETVTSLFDTGLSLPQGYSESKHVAARILAVAGHRMGVVSAIVRAGQLAGSSARHAGGKEWNRHEWFPTLIHTSTILGMIPTTLGEGGRVDWLPMDVAAGGVIDLSLALAADNDDDDTTTRVLHLGNPHTTTWDTLYPVVQAYFAPAITLQAVSYATWLDALAALPATEANVKRVPGLKLLEFYQSMRPGGVVLPALRTRRCEGVSRVVREGGCVSGEEMGKWLEQWRFEEEEKSL